MILVCGIMADEMVELMCARLTDMGFEHRWLNVARFPGDYEMTWDIGNDGLTGYLATKTEKINLQDLSGVYARYVEYQDNGENGNGLRGKEKALANAEYQLALMQLFDVLPCEVVNRARASTSNDSKVYQQSLISSFGFKTPRTLVTTIPEEARTFYEACGRRVIFKSLSGVRSIVRSMRADDLARLSLLSNCPTQFQECVEGTDIRVHTVGQEVFATEIISEASDYRYASRQGASLSARPIELPPEVGAACLDLAGALGLSVAGIDLRQTPDARYCCFEVNPSPAFIFYERVGGQPISEAVARLLRGS